MLVTRVNPKQSTVCAKLTGQPADLPCGRWNDSYGSWNDPERSRRNLLELNRMLATLLVTQLSIHYVARDSDVILVCSERSRTSQNQMAKLFGLRFQSYALSLKNIKQARRQLKQKQKAREKKEALFRLLYDSFMELNTFISWS